MFNESNIIEWHSKEQRMAMAMDTWQVKLQRVVQPLEQLQRGSLCEHCKIWRMEPQHREPVGIRSHGHHCIRRGRSRGKRTTEKEKHDILNGV